MTKARRIKGIDCNAEAGAGIKLVLVGRFAEMSQRRSAALKWEDLEGVHSMRVASRRLRSALHDFTPYLKKRGLASSLKQIKQIADALGKVRDQDVAILALEQLSSNAPADVSAVLSELINIRQQSRDKARQQLERIITKIRLKQLGSVFSTAVEASSARSKQKSAVPTYIQIASSIILERLRELEKLSNSLYRPSRVKPLHKMRITAKRLRYAIELFQVCWGRKIAPFAEEVARLQQSLGDLHDCDMWIDSFGEHIIESKKKEAAQSHEFAWLLRHFIETRNSHYSEAFDIWQEWEARGFSSMLRDLIKPAEVPAIPVEVPTTTVELPTIPVEGPTTPVDVPAISVEVTVTPVELPAIPDPANPQKRVKAGKKKTAATQIKIETEAS
jgi:CHAD domain-containing protein